MRNEDQPKTVWTFDHYNYRKHNVCLLQRSVSKYCLQKQFLHILRIIPSPYKNNTHIYFLMVKTYGSGTGWAQFV